MSLSLSHSLTLGISRGRAAHVTTEKNLEDICWTRFYLSSMTKSRSIDTSGLRMVVNPSCVRISRDLP